MIKLEKVRRKYSEPREEGWSIYLGINCILFLRLGARHINVHFIIIVIPNDTHTYNPFV